MIWPPTSCGTCREPLSPAGGYSTDRKADGGFCSKECLRIYRERAEEDVKISDQDDEQPAVLFVRLSRGEKRKGEQLARDAGVSLSKLVRMWIWKEAGR